MNKSFLQKSCKILIIINIIFWFLVALYFSFFKFASNNNYLVLKLLLFAEPILYYISFIGISKKIKLIYYFSILLAFGNAVLSITDQIGLFDFISLGLSLPTFLNLLFIAPCKNNQMYFPT